MFDIIPLTNDRRSNIELEIWAILTKDKAISQFLLVHDKNLI